MLRFDVPPVHANAARVDALITSVVCTASLLGLPFLMPILAVMGFVRGFVGHYKCPSHRLATDALKTKGWAGPPENAGAKMFANKILFVAASIASILYFMDIAFWIVPTTALLVFSSFEWMF